jgi:hypothetical protein
VKVDITINELVVFPLGERVILRGYEEFSDLPDNRSLSFIRSRKSPRRKFWLSPIPQETNRAISTTSGT